MICRGMWFKVSNIQGGHDVRPLFSAVRRSGCLLQPLLPTKVRGVPRVDDRRVISDIVHVIRSGLMWHGAPTCYGPHKTLYDRFVCWSKAGIFDRIFAAPVAETAASGTVMIDTTHPMDGGDPTATKLYPRVSAQCSKPR